MKDIQTKSKRRVADYGEVFTAEREVNAMLDLVKQETERIDSRFLEPACGNGNFIAEILQRKLKVVRDRYRKNSDDYERYAIISITSVYGIDILEDNVEECRKRLFAIFDKEYMAICRKKVNDETRNAVKHILVHNILCGDALTLRTTDDEPIVFCEWSTVNGFLLKRRDFRLDHMLEGHDDQMSLEMVDWQYDEEIQAFIPLPFREFAPKHYRRIVEDE